MESHPVQTFCFLVICSWWHSDVCKDTDIAQGKSWLSGRVELSLGRAPRECAQERTVEQVVLPLQEEIADVMQFTTLERGPDRIAKQVADITVAPGLVEIVAVVQEVVKLVPQERVQRIDGQLWRRQNESQCRDWISQCLRSWRTRDSCASHTSKKESRRGDWISQCLR